MARNSFLSADQKKQALEILASPEKIPTGDPEQLDIFSHQRVSEFIGDRALELFKAQPEYKDLEIILLGSWGRGELTSNSDLDVLILGSEAQVLKFKSSLELQGLKLRYRVPEDSEDWSKGVDIPDILSLWKAKALRNSGQKILKAQQEKFFKDKIWKKKILKFVTEEKKVRKERFDSIINFLEPNLKFGPGGLRDLYQAQIILDLFPEKFPDSDYEVSLLNYYLGFFLSLRHRLALTDFSDQVVSSEQIELAKWMGFKDNKSFMRELLRGFSRIDFYTQWSFEKAKASGLRIKSVEKVKLKKISEILMALKKDQSFLLQHRIRREMDQIFKGIESSARSRGKALVQILSKSYPEKAMIAVFQSRLIDKLLPQMQRLFGYVQHDQYHRFTADAHILQVLRQVRARGKKLRPKDYQTLMWSALYHDLAKGMGGDHSETGEAWVQSDLKSFGFPQKFIQEVSWVVKNHLILSEAAFRKNAKDPATWKYLFDQGLTSDRLRILKEFTIVDICGTNPEAWNKWKARLLDELCLTLEKGGTHNLIQAQARLSKLLKPQQIDSLDSSLLEQIPAAILIKDFQNLQKKKFSEFEILHVKQGRLWIRFYQAEDKKGVLLSVTQRLFALGISIQNAVIQTIPGVGVYDWFQVQSSKGRKTLEFVLAQNKSVHADIPKVRFSEVEVVSRSPKEWVISFKGQDQRGMLLRACQALTEANFEISSARVHTWGRQVDDLFHIVPNEHSEKNFEKMQKEFT